jgi:two-component system, cell cycle response regulator DivK
MSSVDAEARILLVEDNETIRRAFAILLEESGYDVLQAGSGAEALDLATRLLPDLVLMDLGLPDISGLEVTRKLKADPHTTDIAIVAITGRALETDQNACIAAGCTGYLAKPIDTRQLLERIPTYIGRRGEEL